LLWNSFSPRASYDYDQSRSASLRSSAEKRSFKENATSYIAVAFDAQFGIILAAITRNSLTRSALVEINNLLSRA
jgi:hypothetical protein